MKTTTRLDVVLNITDPTERMNRLSSMVKAGELNQNDIRMITHGILESIKK
jgi:hypothetical protein